MILPLLILIVTPVLIYAINPWKKSIPMVVVTMGTGIILGPSFLGKTFPQLTAVLNGGKSVGELAELGAILLCFLTGMHICLTSLKREGSGVLVVHGFGILIPFLTCSTLGWVAFDMIPSLDSGCPRYIFALAIGLCGAACALPVLSLVLKSFHLSTSELGRFCLTGAVISDIALWAGVSTLMLLCGTKSVHPVVSLLVLMGLFAALIWIVKPWLEKSAHLDPITIAKVVVIMFLSAEITDLIGMHFLIGAFLAGVIIPEKLKEPLEKMFEGVTLHLLVPIFLGKAGLTVVIDAGDPKIWISVIVLSALAIASKVLGMYIGTKLQPQYAKFLWSGGILLSTKGIVEIVLASMLLKQGLITQATYSILVLMAVAVTLVTPIMFQTLRKK